MVKVKSVEKTRKVESSRTPEHRIIVSTVLVLNNCRFRHLWIFILQSMLYRRVPRDCQKMQTSRVNLDSLVTDSD